VWGTGQVDIASFLRNLPANERTSLMGIFEDASSCPGISLDRITATPAVLNGARKVGLIQAATASTLRKV
jgi:hypothetical protein